MLQSERLMVRFLMSHWIFNFYNPPSRNLTLGSTQFLTELSTSNSLEGKGQPTRKTDKPNAICDPTV
jgi:hypothetical protein